jgi:hypothetical protein
MTTEKLEKKRGRMPVIMILGFALDWCWPAFWASGFAPELSSGSKLDAHTA